MILNNILSFTINQYNYSTSLYIENDSAVQQTQQKQFDAS